MTLDVKKTRASRMDKKKSGIHLIAQLANVSIGTVDRALHERRGIKEATRQHILQIARQIGYTPNLAARSLSVAKSSARVGVCIPREIHFFYDQLWSGVLEEARNVGNWASSLRIGPFKCSVKATPRSSRTSSRAASTGLFSPPEIPRI